MTSTVKIESVKYEDCFHISTCTCHVRIKEEPLDGEYRENIISNGVEIRQEENVDIKEEEQDIGSSSSYVQMEVEVSTSEFESNIVNNANDLAPLTPEQFHPSDQRSAVDINEYSPSDNIQQQNTPAHSPICGPLNSSLDVQMEIEVSTSELESNVENEDDLVPLTSKQFHPSDQRSAADLIEYSQSDNLQQQNTPAHNDLISGPVNSSPDVQVEVDHVSTSEPQIEIDNNANDLAPVTPEQFHPPTMPHLTEQGDYIDQISAVDQQCFDLVEFLRSPQSLQRIDNGRCNPKCPFESCSRRKRPMDYPPYKPNRANCQPSNDHSVRQQLRQCRQVHTKAHHRSVNRSSITRRKTVNTGSSVDKRTYHYIPISEKTLKTYHKSISDIGSNTHSREQLSANENQLTDQGGGSFVNDNPISSQELRDLLLPGSEKVPTFSSNLALNQHYARLHTTQLLPYACALCNLRFTTKNQLDTHMLRHRTSGGSTSKRQYTRKERTRWFRCIECKVKCTSIDLLDEHMEKQHPLNILSDLK